MISIMAHRGMWVSVEEKNTLSAFKLAFSNGFGCELDVRDANGKLVITHDPAGETAWPFRDLLDCWQQSPIAHLPLAINIKSDGLTDMVSELLKEYKVENYFVFDMSVPDTLGYLNKNLSTYARISEFEPISPLLEYCQGVWFDHFKWDAFHIEGCYAQQLLDALCLNQPVCIVSEELHGRDPENQWALIKTLLPKFADQIMLCTDFPVRARHYFAAQAD